MKLNQISRTTVGVIESNEKPTKIRFEHFGDIRRTFLFYQWNLVGVVLPFHY